MIKQIITLVIMVLFSFGNCAVAQEIASALDEVVPAQSKAVLQQKNHNQVVVVSQVKKTVPVKTIKTEKTDIFKNKEIIKQQTAKEIKKIPLNSKNTNSLNANPPSNNFKVQNNNPNRPHTSEKNLFNTSADNILPKVPEVKIPEPFTINATAEDKEYKKISLKDAIDYALNNNLDIKGNRLNTEISKNNIKAANRLQNPSIINFFNFGKAATDNPNMMGVLFPIEIAKRGARKNLAKSSYELTKGNVKLAELNLRLDVRTEYINLIATKSTLKILDEHRKLLQELVNVSQRKFEVGASPQMDVIQAKMALNQHLILVNTSKTNILTARYSFNKILNSRGLDTLDDSLLEQKEFVRLLTPSPETQLPDFDKVLAVAMEKRLDLKNAKQDVDVAQKNLTVVLRQRIPDIEIGSGYMFTAPQLSTSDELTQGMYVAGNITNIPLFYQYTPEIKNAKIQVEQKQLVYESLKNQATMNLKSAYEECSTAQANLNYYSDILLSESQQFLKMAVKSYNVGKTSITDLIFIQQSYRNILMGYTNALCEYYNSWINLLRETNDEDLMLHG